MDRQESLKEKRKYRRIIVSLKVTYKVTGDVGEAEIETVDISAGGLSVMMNKILKTGTLLEINMSVEASAVFSCAGKVVWQDMRPRRNGVGKFGYLTGLEFVGLELNERLRLIYYCHAKEKARKEHR